MPFAFEIACSLEFSQGKAEFLGVLGSTWGFFKGSMRADLGTVLGLKGGTFGVFLRAELGQI
jgi:hypothetical protein